MATPRALLNSPIILSSSKANNITQNCLDKLIAPPFFSIGRFRFCCNYPTTSSSANKNTHKIQSPQLVSLEYADLNLSDKFCQEVGHVRIRQHVNPLRAKLMIPAEVPDWNKTFKDATLPLTVDIGSGSGRFLLWVAKRNPHCRNYLGIEIREKLVKRANYWVDELALSNIHFLFANAMVTFKQLVTTYPGPVKLVTILCPDPHFKKKHHKRRVVQKPLVDSIVDCLMPCGQVFIHSDIFDVALDMRNHFDAEEKRLVHIDRIDSTVHCNNEGWLLNNPLGIRTEREIYAENEGAQIYRRMYQKVGKIFPDSSCFYDLRSTGRHGPNESQKTSSS